MSEIEITVKANFSTKLDLAKTVRRIVLMAILVIGLLYQHDFSDFKSAANLVITGKYISKFQNRQLFNM